MALFEGKTPAERNKMIAAIAFGALALLLLGRMFFGSDGETPPRAANANNRNARPAAGGTTTNGGANGNAQPATADEQLIQMPRELAIERISYNVPDAGRNIFAFYVAPTPLPKVSVEPVVPTPTPTPPPPLQLSAIAPTSVMARTGNFTLQLSGDKFTPETRVYIDGQELPTTFASAQQLSTTVPAALISAPGARTIVARTPDNTLYSDQLTLNVAAPPTPQYTFIGILGGRAYNDKAILKAQNNDLITVQRGDTVAGRFKVTSISTRSVELTDAQLQVKHTLPYVEGRTTGGAPGSPSSRFSPPPKPATADDSDNNDDDEPQD
jgi:hypothetical protein